MWRDWVNVLLSYIWAWYTYTYNWFEYTFFDQKHDVSSGFSITGNTCPQLIEIQLVSLLLVIDVVAVDVVVFFMHKTHTINIHFGVWKLAKQYGTNRLRTTPMAAHTHTHSLQMNRWTCGETPVNWNTREMINEVVLMFLFQKLWPINFGTCARIEVTFFEWRAH